MSDDIQVSQDDDQNNAVRDDQEAQKIQETLEEMEGSKMMAEERKPVVRNTDDDREGGRVQVDVKSEAPGREYDGSWTLDPKVFDEMGADHGMVNDLIGLAKKYQLSKETTEGLMKDALMQGSRRDMETLLTQRNEWRRQAMNDREIGGPYFAANLNTAKRALDVYGTPEIREMLASTGMGDNPEVIRMFYRIGKTLSEDSMVAGGMSSNNNVRTFDDAAEALFGKR